MTKQDAGVIALVCALFMIWPTVRTMSYRETLFALSLVIGCYLCMRHHVFARGAWRLELRTPVMFLVFLTAWMMVVALYISPEPQWSLDELRGQWTKALCAIATGGFAAALLGRHASAGARLVLWISATLIVHMAFVDMRAIMSFVAGEPSVRANGLTEESDKASYLTNMALALLIGEFLARLRRGKRLLPVGNWVLYVALALTLFSLYVERMRNGMGVAVVMIILGLLLYLSSLRHQFKQRWQYLSAVSFLGVIAAGLLLVACEIKPGVDWQRFSATVPIAWDTQNHKGWLNESKYGLPKLADGTPVDPSAYLRIAWFKEGLTLTSEQPWGVGFGRNAFGHAITDKYAERKGHSHSSFIDLMVGIGIPGMVLWLGFLFSLLWLAHKGFAVGWGYMLFFVVVDFGTRMIVDSIARDHMLQMFMFLAGLLSVQTARHVRHVVSDSTHAK